MHKKIIAFLDDAGLSYEKMDHDHVHSSEDAAKVRGTKLEEAAKALVLETKSGRMFMCVVSGHRRLSLKKIKQLIGETNVSLAHPDRVFERTGCKVGTVPPFGNLFEPPLQMYVDTDVLSRSHVVFSAATHNDSVRMKSDDWARLTGAEVVDIGND